MCELIFVDSKDEKINKIILYSLLFTDSLNNEQGTGLFNANKIWKSNSPAYTIENLGEIINGNIKGPVMGHVRLASNKLLCDNEHCHPFEFENIVLAHNGKLSPRNNDIEVPKNRVDSEFFADNLDKYLSENLQKPFPENLAKFMEEWKGKFAFLIFNKVENKFYAVRGRTALLHYAKFKYHNTSGIIINTDGSDLLIAINLINNMSNLILPDFGKIELDEIKEFEKESIYEINGLEVVKVGEIKENQDVIKVTFEKWNENLSYVPPKDNDKTSEKIVNLILSLDMSLVEINNLAYTMFHKNLTEMNKEEFEKLIKLGEKLKAYISESKSAIWRKIRDIPGIYDKIEFPWMLNSVEKLK